MNKIKKFNDRIDPNFTPEKRDLIFKIANGIECNIKYLFFLDQFENSMDIYRWLNKNQIKGKWFKDMFEQQFRGDWLSCGREVLKRVYGINTQYKKGELKILKTDLKDKSCKF